MKCVDSKNYIMKFFDRELNDIEEIQLKQHLKTCNCCSEEFNTLKEIFDIVEQDSGIEPPEDFELQVMSRIAKETKMYKNRNENNAFVYNILLISASLIFAIIFGGVLWDNLRAPLNLMQMAQMIIGNLQDFALLAISVCKGIIIALFSVSASIFKTYYFEYILLAILFIITQGVFFKMVRHSNGGAQ